MHLEFLVEDQSGRKMLDNLVPKIIAGVHTFKIHWYKGIGRIPKNLSADRDPSARILLDQLPRLLRGYGKEFSAYPPDYHAAVVLVCDLDNKNQKKFRSQLEAILHACNPKPETRFCFAIEEGEAWLLGDLAAVKTAYPKAKSSTLDSYRNDSICGTWEVLADALYAGGAAALSKKGYQAVGTEKSRWAENICPHINVDRNASPSFRAFKKTLHELTGSP